VQAVDFERIVGLWPAVLDHVRQSGSELLSAVFQTARPIAVDAERDVLEVGFPPSAAFNKRKAEAGEARDRFAEAAQKCPPLSEESVVVLIVHDHVQVEIGILVSRSRCVRTTEEGGHDACVLSTGSHETVECRSINPHDQSSTPFPNNAYFSSQLSAGGRATHLLLAPNSGTMPSELP
jgi:hypothetical protein